MINEKITIKNIIYAIFSCLGIYFFLIWNMINIYFIIIFIKNPETIMEFLTLLSNDKYGEYIVPEIISILLMIIYSILLVYGPIMFLKVFICILKKNLFPKRYSIYLIKKYIKLKELKEILKDEKFEKIAIKDNNDNIFDFYASKNWVYMDRLYIPKAIVSKLYCRYQNYHKIVIELFGSKKITNINIDYTVKDIYKFVNLLKRKTIIPNISNNITYRLKDNIDYNKRFLEEIKTKEDFLQLVKKDRYYTKNDFKK